MCTWAHESQSGLAHRLQGPSETETVSFITAARKQERIQRSRHESQLFREEKEARSRWHLNPVIAHSIPVTNN
ncbi:hypothetical protein Y1Q_0014756 [Alligator mississippiensis]|uniref:Uncharacterized protein n=1 Tax=Alligator mississippiensis TaxID=8496 RepID=A0A151M1U4_ALLMI|nr:hypothetical protein Y1Q_0014756 [Alligator mississippiensis]